MGADVESTGFRWATAKATQVTPLHVAAFYNKPAFCVLLLANGADIDAQTPNSEETPLHYAARGPSVDSVRALIEQGATLDIEDVDREIPLEHAANAATVNSAIYGQETGLRVHGHAAAIVRGR